MKNIQEVSNFDENPIFEGLKKVSIKGDVLVPSSEIARLHGVETKVINQSFKRHKGEFVKGTDYYTFTREELGRMFPETQTLTQELFTNNKQKVVYLFSYKGYYTFVKSINSKQAWTMYHQMKEIVFKVIEMSQREATRLRTKGDRKLLTDVLYSSGENERMHGHGYSNYTLMLYKVTNLKDRFKVFKKEFPNGNFRDTLSAEELSSVSIAENMANGLITLGHKYNNISDILMPIFELQRLGEKTNMLDNTNPSLTENSSDKVGM